MYNEIVLSPGAEAWIVRAPKLPFSVFILAGAPITEPLPEPLTFEIEVRGGPVPDYLSLMIPVFSDRLVEALREAGVDNLQTFPAVLVDGATKERWEGYQAINILGKVACADMDKSTCSEIGAGMVVIRELWIHDDAAEGLLLFRLGQSPYRVLIHDKVADHLLSRPELTGFDLYTVNAT